MSRLSSKLRDMKWGDDGRALGFWCPGCDDLHVVVISKPTGSCWSWDGNVNRSTFSPSILVSGGGDGVVCHSFVRDGQIQFLSDSSHKLSGKTVEIPDWPYAEGEYGGV